MPKTSFLKTSGGGRPLKVMLGAFGYQNRHTVYSLYTPLSIGMIAQYAKQQFGNDIDISLFHSVGNFFEQARLSPPDIVGFSVYNWNTSVTQYAAKRLREMFGQNVLIILGGPSIDSEKQAQHKFITGTFPEADALIVNEGELGFHNVVEKFLGNHETLFKDPIDGAVFLDENQVVEGLPVGLTLDLTTMGSPYLSGIMDDFMDSDFQPLIQTSRFCPYTCTFCVSGKNRGKLRGFPIEQVEEELKYVSKKYADRPHHTMYLADENFGILKRDVEIAEAIKKCKADLGYPQSVFFYNDKRFTDTSRDVLEVLKDITQYGVTLSLQTKDPSVLKAIKRTNVTDKEIDDAIIWAKKRGLETYTEFIFGLPHETSKNFLETLDRSIERGFDTVNIYNLVIMDGIEMNRQNAREEYGIETKYRPLGTHYGTHEEAFFAECEEVVVGTDSLTYENFLEMRGLNFMFSAVYNQRFQTWFFNFIKNLGISPSGFFLSFVKPDRNIDWPEKYLLFLDDLMTEAEGELFNSREELIAHQRQAFESNENEVTGASRLNIKYGARLAYLENDWLKSVLLRHLDKIMGENLSNQDRDIANSLIDLAEQERVNLRCLEKRGSLTLPFDVINWKKNKYKEPLNNLKMQEKSIKFTLDKTQASMINGFQNRFNSYSDWDFYNQAIDYIIPRRFLLYSLAYDNVNTNQTLQPLEDSYSATK